MWEVINALFAGDSLRELVSHQTRSFDEFVSKHLGEVIEGFNPITVQTRFNEELKKYGIVINIDIKNPTLGRPIITEKDGSTKLMTPQEARLRNFSYSGVLYADIHTTIRELRPTNGTYIEHPRVFNNVPIGRIPVMVGSSYCITKSVLPQLLMNRDECKYDVFSYFIINGTEKSIVSQDRCCENRTFVFPSNKSTYFSHVAEIRSVADNVFAPPKLTVLKYSTHPNEYGNYVRCTIHHVRVDIPLFVLFRVLGVESDKDIIRHIVYDIEDEVERKTVFAIRGSIMDGNGVFTQKDAMEYICKYLSMSSLPREIMHDPAVKARHLMDVLRNEFLPHVGPNFRNKAVYLGYMARRLLKKILSTEAPADDRDSYINKRVDTPGVLMANIFRQYYGKMVKDVKKMVSKELHTSGAFNTGCVGNLVNKHNITRIIKSTIIDSGLRYALSTGIWGLKNNKNTRHGVAQVLNRMTFFSSVSHMRRINTPIEKNGKLVQPRRLHTTQMGMVCPAETPEGASIGIVKNLALTVNITCHSDSTGVREMCVANGMEILSGKDLADLARNTRVFVNGDLIGVHKEPMKLHALLKKAKYCGELHIHTCVYWDKRGNNIIVSTEAGRCVRPLFTIRDNKLVLTKDQVAKVGRGEQVWRDLICAPDGNAAVEYLDVLECNEALIAFTVADLEQAGPTKTYTHMELHPSMMLGVLAGSIPFSNHNQSPRNSYQCLSPDEPVLMEDGSTKKILDVRIGDCVVTFDPATKETSVTKVVHQYVRPTSKPVYKITTTGGRTIRATVDHKFMTQAGWMPVENFSSDTLLAIFPHEHSRPLPATDEVPWVILDAAYMTAFLRCKGVPDATVEATVSRLHTDHILPLTIASPLLPIIARVFGCAMWCLHAADMSVTCTFETRGDADNFSKDIRLLGGSPSVVMAGGQSCVIRVGCHIAAVLYGLLGWTCKMPEWLKTGPLEVKRQFLRAAHSKLVVSRFSRRAARDDTLFAKDVCEMLSDLAINVDNRLVVIEESPTNLAEFARSLSSCYNQREANAMALYSEWVQLKNQMSFEAWKKSVRFEGNLMFVPIETIVLDPSVTMISDITVESENHSFIGGGRFAVSNSAMGKQAIGIYASNYLHRYDTLAHVLNYPQRPLVATRISKYLQTDNLPNGMNVIVAIATYSGFNQEDAVILNKSALERGMFNSTFFRTYKEQNQKNHATGEEEFFAHPVKQNASKIKPYNYGKLGADGFVPENTYIDDGDVVVGKCMPNKIEGVIEFRDASVTMKNGEAGHVDRNVYKNNYFNTTNGDGYDFCKVRVRSFRMPTVGDKFACYSPDHEVLTTKGWVRIDKLLTSHEVATLVNGSLVYQCPTEVQSYPYNGDMYRVATSRVNLLVTPNHRMYVSKYGEDKFEVRLAEQIKGKKATYLAAAPDFVPEAATMTKKLVRDRSGAWYFQTKAGPLVLLEHWIEFYGTWAIHGCITPMGQLSIPSFMQGLMETLAALPNIGLTASGSGRDEQHNTSYNFLYADDLGPMIDGKVTCLPDWVWSLDTRQCRALVDALCRYNTVLYMTSRLADDVHRLCVHAGYMMTRKLMCLRVFKVIITKKAHTTVNRSLFEKNDELVRNYQGHVYCCTVPLGDGVIYVRRQGGEQGGVFCGQSRMGQKGTCGMVFRQEDMPFTREGISPDIIINPHAIPSRMTVGQLMECIMGKACCQLGTFGDGTPFGGVTADGLRRQLMELGLESSGNEIMYNGRTGEQIETSIFIGPTYYQRLKHMVADKVHGRASNGPLVMLTRQPADGRSRDGGLRLGEMENDCMLAHGVFQFLKERFVDCSDNFRVFVCKRCHRMAPVNPTCKIYACSSCKNTNDFAQVRIPYACKLFLQEITALGIDPKLLT